MAMQWGRALVGVAAVAALGGCAAEPRATEVPRTARKERPVTAPLAVPFEENQGQWPAEVRFGARHFAGAVWVTQDGALVHALRGPRGAPGERAAGFTLVERFASGATVRAEGAERAAAQVSYFRGDDPSRWRSAVSTFERLSLGEVWPGIEVRLSAHAKNVEKLFHVRPGADVSAIAVTLEGPLAQRVDEGGRLVLDTPHGTVTFSAPVAFQDVDGARRDVPVRYSLRGEGYGFVVGPYDATRELVIDPVLQSTYLGGDANDTPAGVAVADDGTVLVVAATGSDTFPGVSGGFAEQKGNAGDFVVSRLSADLSTVLQSTYLGGQGDDRPAGIVLDGGDVIVFGSTTSPDFPTTPNAGGTSAAGGVDGVISRLDLSLTTLVDSTYIGGSGSDEIVSLAVRDGDLWVAGYTRSLDWPFADSGAQGAHAGGDDLVVSLLTSDLSTLVRSTFLGGSDDEYGGYLALAPDGDVLVLGYGESTDLPGTAGGVQEAPAGDVDLLIARFSPDLETLRQSTFVGGAGYDEGRGIAVTAEGSVVVLGNSDSDDFPGTAGGAQEAPGGDNDVVLARLAGDLTSLEQSTYLGTDGWESGFALAIDVEGQVLVGGETESDAYPGTADAPQATRGGDFDGTLTRLDPALTSVLQSTYLGGADTDAVFALAPDGPDVVAAVVTRSTDFPHVEGGALSDAPEGGDIALARLSGDLREAPLCDDELHGGPPCAPALECGDGLISAPEACDDGNDVAGDGCDDACAVEEGYACEGSPSVCTLIPGEDPEVDAGVVDDDAGDPDDGAAAPDGCACGATEAGGSRSLLALLGLALAAGVTRRRRRAP